MILVTAIVGLAIIVALQWREVGPLRAANRQMRTELGFLNIDDPNKACAIQLSTEDPWKWRIYLPPGGKHKLLGYSGHLPTSTELHGQAWFDAIKKNASGFSSTGSPFQGEFVLEARLTKRGDQWMLLTNPGGGISIHQPSGDWLSDPGPVGSDSGVGTKQQTVFEPGQPILLMHMGKPIVTKLPGGTTTRESPSGPADGFAIWIEQGPPVTASTKPASNAL